MKNKKAQAGIEFLMTYGWAILLFFLTIGTLAYSGVFSPTSFLPEECNLPGGLICEDYIIGEGEAKFIVRNGLSDRITITAFKVLDFEGGSLCSSSGDTNISRGGIGTIVTICDTDNQLKQKLILQVDFYLNDELDLIHKVSGTMRSGIKGITLSNTSPINNYAPTGIFGPFNTNFVSSGWAVDNDTPMQSIDVEMVLYSPLGERDVIVTIRANVTSNPGFPYPGDHRFTFTVPESLRTGVHIIHAYAIDAQTGERKELTGSPQMTGNVSLQLAGEPETVYNWTIDRCRQEDIPDLPTRVFRDAQGNLQLFSSFYMWYRESGPNFDNLTRNCNPVFTSHNNSDPSQYDDYEWLSATYRTSGNNIYALIHEEYHGEDFGNCPSGNQYMCLRMSITQGMSTDGGNTFQHAPAPQHLVASAPYQYDSAGGPFGYMVPSNIIKHADGNYYAFFNIQGGGTLGEGELKDGVCLARTASLENPSWRAWNGSEFSVRFINPYLELNVDSKDYVCEPIRFGSGSIAPLYSVLFNKNISKYVMSTIRAGISGGKTVTGVYYAFSNDIIHWTAPQLLWEVPRPAQNLPPGVEGILYGTLIDHNSSSINFETMGSEAYFYYKVRHMRSSQDKLYDRDLMRRRVIINYS